MTDQPPQPAPQWPQGAVELAPVYCNVFTVVATPGIVRLAFGEAFGSPQFAAYHAAVAMTPDDARQLVRSLAGLLGVQLAPEGTQRG